MRITATAQSRATPHRDVADDDISVLSKAEDGVHFIVNTKTKLRLSGDYMLSISLTRAELDQLLAASKGG